MVHRGGNPLGWEEVVVLERTHREGGIKALMAELGWRVGKLAREHGELVVTKSSRISCLPVAPEQARRRLVGSATLLEKLVVPGGLMYPPIGRSVRGHERN